MTDGRTLIAENEVRDGQKQFGRAMGGMQVGSVWGLGSYVATIGRLIISIAVAIYSISGPVRICKNIRQWHSETQAASCSVAKPASHEQYDPASGTIKIGPGSSRSVASNLDHYKQVFINGSTEYAIQKGAQEDPERVRENKKCRRSFSGLRGLRSRPGGRLKHDLL
jgi:nitric oxide reductase subunit B